MTTWGARATTATAWTGRDAAAAASAFLTDTFAGTEDLAAHTSDSGATWAYLFSTAGGTISVASSAAQLSTVGLLQAAQSSVVAPSNNYTVTATIVRSARATGSAECDVIALLDLATYYLAGLTVNLATGVTTVTLSGGGLNSSTVITSMVAGTPVTLTLRVSGSAISVLVDGTTVLSGTDTAVPSRPSVAFQLVDSDVAAGGALSVRDITAASLAGTATTTPNTAWGAEAAASTAWTPRSAP